VPRRRRLVPAELIADTEPAADPDLTARHVVILNWRDARHPQAGGAELYCFSAAKQLVARGSRVTIVTSRPAGTPMEEIVEGVRIVRRGGTYTVYGHALAWVRRHRDDIDAVIDSQNGIPFFAPLVTRPDTPVLCLIHHVHQRQFDMYFRWPMNKVGRFLEGPLSRLVYGRRSVIVVSPSTRSEVRRDLRLRGEIHIVPCGIDVPPVSLEEHALARSVEPLIVCVGRLVPHKQLHLLIEALPGILGEHPDLCVVIVGGGPDEERLRADARRLGVERAVAFRGRVDDAERDRLLGQAWLTVNPSAGEGWGLSVIEANSVGLPAVAFRVPGLRDAVQHGVTGWLVEQPDDLGPAVSDAVSDLRDPVRARAWALRARRWAEGFTWERTGARIDVLLRHEGDRLRRRIASKGTSIEPERRVRTDLACRVEVPAEPAHVAALATICRRTDVWAVQEGVAVALLRDTDEQGARSALRRIGLEDLAAVRLARPADWLIAGASPSDVLSAAA
jgi:glycosyltransferase involved in cell wall biosynthesis